MPYALAVAAANAIDEWGGLQHPRGNAGELADQLESILEARIKAALREGKRNVFIASRRKT